jgi:hypothetical protein
MELVEHKKGTGQSSPMGWMVCGPDGPSRRRKRSAREQNMLEFFISCEIC